LTKPKPTGLLRTEENLKNLKQKDFFLYNFLLELHIEREFLQLATVGASSTGIPVQRNMYREIASTKMAIF
jgi:hypothetical protein